MYDCKDCDKRYKTRTSLTRHTHNHSQDGRHTCSVCCVSFRRHDLLARHGKIHRKIHAGPVAQTSDARLRRRCHTACDICRSERRRCDGALPCSACILAGKFCSYAPSSRRVSQAARHGSAENIGGYENETTGGNHVFTNGDSTSPEPPNADQFANTSNGQAITAGSTDFSSDANNFVHNNNSFQRPDAAFLEEGSAMDLEQRLDVLYETSPSVFPDSSRITDDIANVAQRFDSIMPWSTSYDISWPWTHQSIFFQEGAGLNHTDSSSFAEPPFNLALINGFGNTQGVHIGDPSSNYQAAIGDSLPEQRTTGDHHSNRDCHTLEELQEATIENIILYAFDMSKHRSDQTQYWELQSQEIGRAFLDLPNSTAEKCLLYCYVDLYFRRFHPLWPLLWQQNLEYSCIHPALYLVLVSIGTMYNGPASQRFGSILHEKLRNALFILPLELDLPENHLIHIGCSLLLTQVAALYFEQQQAFSTAQRLGGMLVAFAHRLELFTCRPVIRDVSNSSSAQNATSILAAWVINESRKRLAYGVMRAETFISVLLNTKPLVDYEQINLELLVPDQIWTSKSSTLETLLDAINQDRKFGKGILFSDLVRIALDEDEPLPLTKANAHELLLFGLQNAVWRFSHDPDVFFRLSGRGEITEHTRSRSSFVQRDYLDFTARKMTDLRKEKHRTLHALEKWKQGLANSQVLAAEDDENRSIYLSSTLLYHLSLIRLNAPISIIQQAAYELNSSANLKYEMIEKIHHWARSSAANIAIEHACAIWTLIESETSRPQPKQARYNILALIGLHQAAVAVWSYASVHKTSGVSLDMLQSGEGTSANELRLSRENIEPLLANFVKLYPRITPSWGMQSSFSQVALDMSKKPLPCSSI